MLDKLDMAALNSQDLLGIRAGQAQYSPIPTHKVDPACRIHRHQELDDLGVTGLKSQDSLGITRARLAKQRLNESTALLDDIKNMEVRFDMSTK